MRPFLKKNHKLLLELPGIPEEKMQAILVTSGYLRGGILFAALRKRWRVEYGVDQRQGAGLNAVPFRAKDVAADRTEFGHPDMAILLTQLSYYYSGLEISQVLQCLETLKNSVSGASNLYASWIRDISVDSSVKTLDGINLQDRQQLEDIVYPVLCWNPKVINFFLEKAVFSKQCKVFPGKIATNAWDLCYENSEHPTTGFSGTNDTQLLLPPQLSQNDLPSLLSTNEEVENLLKIGRNSWRRSLDMGVSSRELLSFLKHDNLHVLIDAGALMLELGNEGVAHLWLEVDSTLERVIYFNDNGHLVIKQRLSYSDELLAHSPFKNGQVNNCAVYLDDQHTRCTDIKLPPNYSACVTVGSGMRRDKLIQACMRMRKLQSGQSVRFYLSHEVHTKICKMEGVNRKAISVENILNWTKENSRKFEENGLVQWAASGRNYAQKLAADEFYESGFLETSRAGNVLGNCCQDADQTSINFLYGSWRDNCLLTDLIPAWFATLQRKLLETSHLPRLTPESLRTLERIEAKIVEKCETNIPQKIFLAGALDEEQERELEVEQEREVQVQRPPFEHPATPHLHENVVKVVRRQNYEDLHVAPGISIMADIFKKTTFWNAVEPKAWGKGRLFATHDFIEVIQRGTGNDLFLRPIRYFASFQNIDKSEHDTTKILLLSFFEADKLIQIFRSLPTRPMSGRCLVTLHMFSGGRVIEGDRSLEAIEVPSTSVVLSDEIMAPVLIAGGNLFFQDLKEQQEFASFLGIMPRPWSMEIEEILDGAITPTGFILPGNPKTAHLREKTEFQTDPTHVVRMILKCRNELVRESDHVVKLLDTCSYILEKKST